MKTGVVKFYDSVKGLGVVVSSDGAEYPIYKRSLDRSRIRSIGVGDRVVFDVYSKNGRSSIEEFELDTQQVVTSPQQQTHVKATPQNAREASSSQQSPLEVQVRQNRKSAPPDPTNLNAWQILVEYIRSGQTGSVSIHSQEIYFTRSRPPYDGNWSQLSAWCKLVGMKLSWELRLTFSGSGNLWDLVAVPTSLPSSSLKARLLAEHGSPPGYS